MNRSYRGRGSQAVYILSLLVVASMIIGMLLSVVPKTSQKPTPTPPIVRATATATPTPAAPTVTPALQPTPVPRPTS